MIAICDSGASKGSWAFIDSSKATCIETSGFNPNTHDPNQYQDELSTAIDPAIRSKVSNVCFYGAGCGESNNKKKVKELLNVVFKNAATIEVHLDLLAVARATCGSTQGIACILGTGSNSGLFDGHNFIDAVPNLGYLLGDEGSGNYVGKLLIRAYSFREMPGDLKQSFDLFHPGGHEAIIRNLYNKERPVNTYLATFMKFVQQHINHPFIDHIMTKNFQDFIDCNVSKYSSFKSVPVHFVGSVGYYFQSILKSCLEKNGMICGKIIAKPLDDLIEYHRSKLQ